MKVLSADREQSQFPHEFLILCAAVLGIDKIEFLNIWRVLDDPAQFALVCGCLFIAHVHPHTVLSKLLVHDATVLIAAVVALPADHMRTVLFERADYQWASYGLVPIIE